MELVISAILDTVFASLAEAGGVSAWLCDRLGRDPEKLAFRAALTQALAEASQAFPGRDLRYFAEQLSDFGGPLLARTLQPAATFPTAEELTAAWLAQINLDSVRYYRADFQRFATRFLASLQHNLENQPPLQWIAQMRTQKLTAAAAQRSAAATEVSATWLAALHAQLQQLNERVTQQSQTNTAGGAVVAGNAQPGRDFVGRDQITIRNYFTGGLGRLPIDYSARIEEFLLEYLGSRRKQVPFGGRATQLAELDGWLDDRRAPPYYLMIAEAGRGKSALVCRWQTQILTRPDVDVIFVPISIRFETATQDVLFAALAARLAAIHGEEMQPAALAADQWRAICQSFLRRTLPAGKQLVVILDGLDEATGWSPGRGLFPGDPPAGLRVLLTARPRAGETGPEGWAMTLGWQDGGLARKVLLPGLDRTGIGEALRSMGNPLDHLATQVDAIGELFRLTAGDPLLVRLYVDALIGQGAAAAYVRAEALQTLQPGLHGYFDRWWDEQHQQWTHEGRDPLVEQEQLLTLLNAVAAALGPLTHSDLAAVSTLTNGLLVRRLAQTINRWLIGDGKSHGYTFSHPRLGYYFWEQLGATEQADWDVRFTAWGATTLAALHSGTIAPKAAPRYLVQHYAAHLTRADAPTAQFYALLSDGWRQAWEAVDVTYSGFLNDIARVEAKAQAAYQHKQLGTAAAIVQQIKVALCRVSISALGHNLTPELLRLALIHQLRTPTQIIALIRLMHDDRRRSGALAASVKHLPVELVAEALTIARGMGDEYARARALGALLPHLQPDLLTEVLTAAKGIGSEYYRAEALGVLAPHLPPVLMTEALAAVRGIGSESLRAKALGALASHLPPALLTEALAAARGIRDDSARARALGELAPHLPKAQQSAVLMEALAAAKGIGTDSVHALGVLASHLPPALLTEALATAGQVGDDTARALSLGALAPHLPPALLTEALTAARGIGSESACAEALGALAPHLPPALLTEALTAARGIRDEYYRARALGALAPHLPEAQQSALLTEALAAARESGTDSARVRALGALAPHLPPALLAEALAAARGIGNDTVRASALGALAPHLPPALMTEALAAARGIGSESARAAALGALAPHLPLALLTEALAVARGIGSEDHCALALSALAPHLPEAQQLAVMTKALAAARGIGSEYYRAEALGALVPHLPPTLLAEALAARKMGDDTARASALGALAPHLPPALLTEALAAVRGIRDDTARAKALVALAPHLPPALLTEALAAVRGIRDDTARAKALVALVPHLPEAQQSAVLTEALAAARESGTDSASALGVLAPHLPPALLAEALATARRIGSEYARARALGVLAPHLPLTLLGEALVTARGIGNDSACARALVALAPHLPPMLLTEALAATWEIWYESARAEALGALAPHLSSELLTEALAAAREMGDDTARARALGALAPYLPPAVLTEALTAIKGMGDEDARARALGALAPYLPPAVLTEALTAIKGMRDDTARARALGALAPHLAAWQKKLPEAAYLEWTHTIHQLSQRPRPQFLRDVESLMPFTLALADEEAPQAATGIFHALQDVCAWWP